MYLDIVQGAEEELSDVYWRVYLRMELTAR